MKISSAVTVDHRCASSVDFPSRQVLGSYLLVPGCSTCCTGCSSCSCGAATPA